jgi:uncharacterized protein (TIGR02145 family)
MSIYTFNNKVLKYNNKLLVGGEPGPVIPYVQIGTQIWATSNLKYDDGGDGIAIKYDVTSEGVNFGTQYYYTWDAATRIVNNIEGWRIPTLTDFDVLKAYLGSLGYDTTAPLRSVSGWKKWFSYGEVVPGTDIFGLNVEPVGSIRSSNPLDDLAALGVESMLRIDSNSPGNHCNFMYGDSVVQKFQNWTYYWGMPDAYIAVRLIKEN